MKVLLTILAIVLVTPALLVVGIALGPAILVVLFIVGIALVVTALAWLVDRARWHHAHRAGVPRLHP